MKKTQKLVSLVVLIGFVSILAMGCIEDIENKPVADSETYTEMYISASISCVWYDYNGNYLDTVSDSRSDTLLYNEDDWNDAEGELEGLFNFDRDIEVEYHIIDESFHDKIVGKIRYKSHEDDIYGICSVAYTIIRY